MSSKRNNPAFLIIILLLASCTPYGQKTPFSQNNVSTQEPSGITVIKEPTQTWTKQPTENDLFSTYEYNFESLTNPTTEGITSNQNGIATTSVSSIQINTDIVKSGSKSLEVSGTIGSQAFSSMTIDLPIKTLFGREKVDLSNKTLSVSVFVTQGSPIDKVYFACSARGQPALIIANVAGDMVVKGRWFSDDINIQRAFENTSAWVFAGLDHERAKEIFRNCEMISIVGQRTAEGESTPTSFIIDDLKWANVSYSLDSVPIDEHVDSLRKYADLRNLKIGSVLFYNEYVDYLLDPKYVQTLAQEFNLVYGIVSNLPTVKPFAPSSMQINESYSDEIFRLGKGANLSRKGFTGVYPGFTPRWIMDEPFYNLQPYLESRIEQDVGRYQGDIYLWDMANETVTDEGDGLRNRQHKGQDQPGRPYGYDYSPWVDGTDTSLIKAEFVKARQADPNAKLFLNDFEIEYMGQRKAETFYNLVASMKKEGVPIDGVGFELHVRITSDNKVKCGWYTPDLDIQDFLNNVKHSVERYAKLGLLVEFSEIEVGILINGDDGIDFSTSDGRETYKKRLAAQAEVYGGLAKIAVENKNVVAFIVWMVSDRYNQGIATGYGDTSIFDAEYKPKPAYYAVLNAFKNQYPGELK